MTGNVRRWGIYASRVAGNLIDEPDLAHAVSNIVPRSERQPDLQQLRLTYVETGVLPQVENFSNQIIYGRRGTGKTHLLQILQDSLAKSSVIESVYLDLRLLGSAHLFTDETRHPAERCVAVFKDLLGILQGHLLDIATSPDRDGRGLQEVSDLSDFILREAVHIAQREVTTTESLSNQTGTNAEVKIGINAIETRAGKSNRRESSTETQLQFTEALRETVIFSEVHQILDRTLQALSIDHLVLVIDEWTSLPIDMQPFIAEFLKRTVLPSRRITLKIGSLEYRSRFTIDSGQSNPIGFELSADITANLDLDDYYVYDRNPDRVTEIFQEVLRKHIMTGIRDSSLAGRHSIKDSVSFRTRLFTEKATFVELVRAGEGVVRDFLGIFSVAYFKARNGGKPKIDLISVEEASRDWYETDKSTVLSAAQREALQKIISDVIGSRQTKMFMLPREEADHPMIQSLFDLRLLHLISRGYSDKENPGQRYNIYALDYGTYVDLKRTKSQPEDLIPPDSGEQSCDPTPDRIVPFADKRSIRRVILKTSIFD